MRERRSTTDSELKTDSYDQCCNTSTNTEKLPLLDYNSDESDEQMEDQHLFEITDKVELGAMADYFFPRIGVKLFYITIAVYLFGDLAIYSAAISKSLRDVTWSVSSDQLLSGCRHHFS